MTTALLAAVRRRRVAPVPPIYPSGSPAAVIASVRRRRVTAVVTPPLVVSDGFFEALTAWFNADAVCMAACPGGLVDTEAASNQTLPYARVWDMENHEPSSDEDSEIEAALSFYAADDNEGSSGDKPARDVGTAVMVELLDPAARGDWIFTYQGGAWRESGCLWIPPGKLVPAGKVAGGRRLWRYDLWFKFFLVKVES